MTYNVAVIGSGPAGFFVTEALLQSGLSVHVDMIERLPTPFGLVRYGVAPDHQKLKSVTALFEGIANDSNFSFLGNVDVGRDVDLAQLQDAYDAVVLATGAPSDRALGIAGEDLPGSVSATEFVAWYNGHPDFQDRSFDLSTPNAVIIGNGNVALDVCRILAKSVEELKRSDITDQALRALSVSKVTDIYLVGRRGPVQAKFTTKELREFGALDQAQPVIEQAEFELNPASVAELASPQGSSLAKNLEILQRFADSPPKARRVHFRFLLAPARIEGQGRVEAVVFDRTRLTGAAFQQVAEPTGASLRIPTGLVLRSVGYKGQPIAGAPFDQRTATIPHRDGRVQNVSGTVIQGLYVVGWIKRGPNGIIGTNRLCAVDTAKAILADFRVSGPSCAKVGRRAALLSALNSAPKQIVDLAGWRKIDAVERAIGSARDKPREKLTSIPAMLETARGHDAPWSEALGHMGAAEGGAMTPQDAQGAGRAGAWY